MSTTAIQTQPLSFKDPTLTTDTKEVTLENQTSEIGQTILQKAPTKAPISEYNYLLINDPLIDLVLFDTAMQIALFAILLQDLENAKQENPSVVSVKEHPQVEELPSEPKAAASTDTVKTA